MFQHASTDYIRSSSHMIRGPEGNLRGKWHTAPFLTHSSELLSSQTQSIRAQRSLGRVTPVPSHLVAEQVTIHLNRVVQRSRCSDVRRTLSIHVLGILSPCACHYRRHINFRNKVRIHEIEFPKRESSPGGPSLFSNTCFPGRVPGQSNPEVRENEE